MIQPCSSDPRSQNLVQTRSLLPLISCLRFIESCSSAPCMASPQAITLSPTSQCGRWYLGYLLPTSPSAEVGCKGEPGYRVQNPEWGCVDSGPCACQTNIPPLSHNPAIIRIGVHNTSLCIPARTTHETREPEVPLFLQPVICNEESG